MPTKYDTVVQTKAPMSKAMDYYSHPENLPKVHPDFVKDVKIISTEGNTTKLEQHMEMMGRNLKAVNTMTRDEMAHKFLVNTIEGDGKGSKITIELKEVPSGTEIHYWAEMEFGALGFFIKGRAKQSFEKVAQEDAKALDAM
ncbi:MAG TPA: SRPBCC family protein [Nitrososphaerales archaeon]|nr:SRPBCC family protein [Nitrososphaerales archaeon]